MQEQKIQECLAIEQLRQLLKQSPDQVIIIDVRGPEEFAEKHIPGTINIPLNELERRARELSKNAIIITVCGKGAGRSAQGAELLKQGAFTKTYYLCGGIFGWYESCS